MSLIVLMSTYLSDVNFIILILREKPFKPQKQGALLNTQLNVR